MIGCNDSSRRKKESRRAKSQFSIFLLGKETFLERVAARNDC